MTIGCGITHKNRNHICTAQLRFSLKYETMKYTEGVQMLQIDPLIYSNILYVPTGNGNIA
jgi:hypothetical protein